MAKVKLENGDASTTQITKAGPNSCRRFAGDDLDRWERFFCSSAAGFISAQRRTPNPDMVVRWCGNFADRAMEEAARRMPKPPDEESS